MGSHTSFTTPVAGDEGPGAASCPWLWWKEVGRSPCDTSWVTEGGGQQTTGSQGNLRLVCQSGSVSGMVSGVKLKVRPNQSISTPTWPWVPSVAVAGTQVSTQQEMALLMPALSLCPDAACLPDFCLCLGFMRNGAQRIGPGPPFHSQVGGVNLSIGLGDLRKGNEIEL